MGLSNLLRKAVGDYRHNKAAAFAHGVRLLTTYIAGAVTGLAVLAYLGATDPPSCSSEPDTRSPSSLPTTPSSATLRWGSGSLPPTCSASSASPRS
jgi:hypothetical protein